MTGLPRASVFGRTCALLGGMLFAASLVYFLLRYRQFGLPSGYWTLAGLAPVLVNTALFSAFALHHSFFARSGLKTLVRSRISGPMERSIYVWISTLLFALTLWAWMPVPGEAWNVSGPGRWLFHAGRISGLVLTILAAAAVDPLELAGIRQAFGSAGQTAGGLKTTGVYGLVRHPIYLGWILLVWSVPVMTGTRLAFAAVSTLYLFAAIPFEERELRRTMVPEYEVYARSVRWRMLPWLY